jgi:hypothetical protein
MGHPFFLAASITRFFESRFRFPPIEIRHGDRAHGETITEARALPTSSKRIERSIARVRGAQMPSNFVNRNRRVAGTFSSSISLEASLGRFVTPVVPFAHRS